MSSRRGSPSRRACCASWPSGPAGSRGRARADERGRSAKAPRS
jgi:hypothetical protein